MNLVKIYYDYTPHFLCEVKNDIETNGELKFRELVFQILDFYWAVAPTTEGIVFLAVDYLTQAIMLD